MNTHFTPGPWDTFASSIFTDRGYLCSLQATPDSLETHANAQLICSAPEMLEVLLEVQASGVLPKHIQEQVDQIALKAMYMPNAPKKASTVAPAKKKSRSKAKSSKVKVDVSISREIDRDIVTNGINVLAATLQATKTKNIRARA